MSFVVYILSNLRRDRTYVGYTNDLEQRIEYHNKGRVAATKYYKPWEVIYTEFVSSEQEAKQREQYWKSGAGRRNLKRIFNGFPPHFRKVRRGSPK